MQQVTGSSLNQLTGLARQLRWIFECAHCGELFRYQTPRPRMLPRHRPSEYAFFDCRGSGRPTHAAGREP